MPILVIAPMNQPPHNHIRELREQVSHAEYRVDTRAVADAIVRRRWAVSVRARPAPARVSIITPARLAPPIAALAA